MLTARGEEIDRVVGFELGADDYVIETVQPARTRLPCEIDLPAHERGADATCFALGTIQMYPERRQCFVGESFVTLTAKEFDLLHELMRGRGNVLTREC